ncbi:ATP-binding cassette domain-containing protein [Paraburkholderia sp. CNPSo 3155]|uniref:ABC transporter ATP-binding protein n=1 Tax=Paraburkholderia atlantica TaxID=2654982 RepID=UPI00128B67D5|nr:ABC transporter ATP-binding protein [Paraburkholderia atlantica]MPW11165.1 ATP-binding cassette domain-containing protein [Paraburkholderia atlantica]
MNDEVVRVAGLTCAFGDSVVLNDVHLSLKRGERRGIIGPNGSGKSTLLNSLSGWMRPRSGSIQLYGQNITGFSPAEIATLGMTRTFQYVQLSVSQTVLANVSIALFRRYRIGYSMWRPLTKHTAVRDEAFAILARLHLTHYADSVVEHLSYGVQKQVELAMLLAAQASVLLLDEPAAGLSEEESAEVLAILQSMSQDIAILVIEHDIDFLLGLAESVTVLSDGRVIYDGSAADVRESAEVAQIYMGTGGFH